MSQEKPKLLRQKRLGLIAYLALASLAVPYLFFCPCINEQFVSQLLFHPTKLSGRQADLATIAGVQGDEVFFSSSHDSSSPQLNGWLYRKPGAKVIVVFNHGNTGNIPTRLWKLKSILESGASLFVYDYRGFGRSDGHPTVSGVIDDAAAAVDYLIEVGGYRANDIVLYGESLGTCISSAVARKYRLKGLVLQSGCMSAESLCKEQVPVLNVYPSSLFFRPPLTNMDYLQGNHPPILFIAGARDELIPVRHSQFMYDNASAPKTLVILPNSSHNDFQPDIVSYQNALKTFFESLGNKTTE